MASLEWLNSSGTNIFYKTTSTHNGYIGLKFIHNTISTPLSLYDNCYARLVHSSGSWSLGSGEDGIIWLGNISIPPSPYEKNLYYYIQATGNGSAESQLEIWSGYPDGISSTKIFDIDVDFTITNTSSAESVIISNTTVPSTAIIGDIYTMTQTISLGESMMYISPITSSTWPASNMRLISVSTTNGELYTTSTGVITYTFEPKSTFTNISVLPFISDGTTYTLGGTTNNISASSDGFSLSTFTINPISLTGTINHSGSNESFIDKLVITVPSGLTVTSVVLGGETLYLNSQSGDTYTFLADTNYTSTTVNFTINFTGSTLGGDYIIQGYTNGFNGYAETEGTQYLLFSRTENGEEIENNIVCFLKDTYVKTSRGEIKIQNIRSSDYIINKYGEERKVNFLARQTIKKIINTDKAYPYIVKKDTFGEDFPNKDTYVSPAHGVYVGKVCKEVRKIKKEGIYQMNGMELPLVYYSVIVDDCNCIKGHMCPHNTMYVNNMLVETTPTTNISIKKFYEKIY